MKKGIVSQRVSAIAPSESLRITSRAKAMAATGVKVCNFAAGEPDFDTPAHIKQAAADALAGGQTKYTPEAGLLTLREAIAEKLRTENGLNYAATQIVVSNGAKHSLFNVFMALLRDEEEVIIPGPYWLSYPEMVRLAGGVPVFVHGHEEHGFKVTAEDIEKAVTSRTKALVLNSPCNPSGIVYTEAELRDIAAVAVKHGFYLVSDEIYEKIIYDGGRHASIGSFSPEVFDWTITVNGFSKAFSMTGWRLGYSAAPDFLTKAMSALQSHSTSGPNTFAQFGAIAALKGPADEMQRMVRAFEERRNYLHARLESMHGIACVKPAGAFYMMPNISRFGVDSVAFAERFLEEHKVAVIPGRAFGAPNHIRISYACSMDDLREGMDRLERFLKGL